MLAGAARGRTGSKGGGGPVRSSSPAMSTGSSQVGAVLSPPC